MLFPSKCPHCGKDIAENPVCITYEEVVDKSLGARAEAHKCIHCKKYIYAFRGFVKKNNDYIVDDKGIICYYPVKKYVDYPNRVKDFCPSAYEIYSQTCSAKDHGLNLLLGAGIRMALEHLVWYYLSDIQGIPKSDLEGKMLGKLIPMLEGNIKDNLYIKILKYFGNKTIHVTDAPNFSIEEAFIVFNLFLEEIDSILLNKELEEKLNAFNNRQTLSNT